MLKQVLSAIKDEILFFLLSLGRRACKRNDERDQVLDSTLKMARAHLLTEASTRENRKDHMGEMERNGEWVTLGN